MALVTLGSAGCWDRMEMNDLAMVQGAAFDADPDGGITMTVNIILPAGFPAAGGATTVGTSAGASFAVVSASGQTLGAAESHLQEGLPGVIFWGQLQTVVIGAALAGRGIAPVVDFVLRENVGRPLAHLYVTRGEASAVLTAASPFRAVNTANLEESSRLLLEPTGPAYLVGEAMVAAGSSFLLPEVEVRHNPPPGTGASSGGGSGGSDGSNSSGGHPPAVAPAQYFLAGGGVFVGGRLVGWLSPEATRGALWLLGETGRGTITMAAPGGATVTAAVDSAQVRRRAVMVGGRPAILVDISVAASVRDVVGGNLRLDSAATMAHLGTLLGQRVEARTTLAVKQAQRMGADPFGFGRLLAAYDPRAWLTLLPTWPQASAAIPIQVRVKGDIRFTGNVTNAPFGPMANDQMGRVSALREDWGITARQIFSVTLALVGATEVLSEPAPLARYAGQDAWLAALIGLPIGAVPLICWYALDRRLPWLTLTEQAQAALGRVLGSVVLLPLLLLFVTILGAAERDVSGLIAGIALPRTPPAVVAAILLLPVVLVVRMGPEVLARMAEVVASVAVGTLFFLAAVAGRNMTASNLLPVLARGWRPVLQGGLLSGAFYTPTVYLLYLLPFRGCARGAALRASLWGLLAIGGLLALTTAVSVMIFGGLTPLLNVPYLQVARTVQLAQFLTHLDPLFVFVWEALSFVKVGVFLYALCLCLAQILGLRDYRPLTLPVAVMTTVAAVTWFSSSAQINEFAARTAPFYGPLLALPVPLIIWAVAALRGMGRSRRGAGAPRTAG